MEKRNGFIIGLIILIVFCIWSIAAALNSRSNDNLSSSQSSDQHKINVEPEYDLQCDMGQIDIGYYASKKYSLGCVTNEVNSSYTPSSATISTISGLNVSSSNGNLTFSGATQVPSSFWQKNFLGSAASEWVDKRTVEFRIAGDYTGAGSRTVKIRLRFSQASINTLQALNAKYLEEERAKYAPAPVSYTYTYNTPSSTTYSAPSSVYYRNCAAARAAGAAPIYIGEPGYSPHLDRDGDGIACEPYYGRY